jgi:hypothetical protein
MQVSVFSQCIYIHIYIYPYPYPSFSPPRSIPICILILSKGQEEGRKMARRLMPVPSMHQRLTQELREERQCLFLEMAEQQRLARPRVLWTRAEFEAELDARVAQRRRALLARLSGRGMDTS